MPIKNILILVKSPTVGLDNTTIIAEAEYFINFSDHVNKFCLSLHYNGNNSFLLINGVKIYQFKGKDSELNA